MPKIVFATGNEGKLKEFKTLIEDNGSWQVCSLKDFPGIKLPSETGTTFRDNAQIKACATAEFTKMIALGDDSGLEVDYLGGLPGINSARFAGLESNSHKNNEKLIKLLEGVPEEKRSARFRCSIAVVVPGQETFFCDGVCEGLILPEPIGSNGFGYDPLFWLPQYGKTMAQLTMEEKNLISHRGMAFKGIVSVLEKILKKQV